jgi:ribosomal-protein-alanine N-acetyltransferase
VERYHLTRHQDNAGYALEVQELDQHDPAMIPVLTELDLLTYSEPTFSRYTLGAMLRYGRVFTITADALVIGACHCLRSFREPSEVVIVNMALRPGWRGHGLGTRFLHGVLERLQAGGARGVVLQVAANNHRAIAVYRSRFGFSQVDIHEDEYRNGHAYLEMRLDLADPLPVLDIPSDEPTMFAAGPGPRRDD